jgi:hypothetical protein
VGAREERVRRVGAQGEARAPSRGSRRRQGRLIAALARKMAGILYAMLRDGTVHQSKVANRTRTAAA